MDLIDCSSPAENTEEDIDTTNLSLEQFEKVSIAKSRYVFLILFFQILKEKVAFGLTLKRETFENNHDRRLPRDIVEARSTVRYMDDGV